METVLFATGNSRKIHEARTTLNEYGLDVESVSVNTDEIQHPDPVEITKAKAQAAYTITKRPVVVSDTSWSIPALGGFPGGYMKDIGIWWSEQDWLAIMAPHEDKRIICHEHVAYFDGATVTHFDEAYEGYFVTEGHGRVMNKYESFERVVVLYGNETMAEQLGRGENASAGETHGHWQQFGEWYAQNVSA